MILKTKLLSIIFVFLACNPPKSKPMKTTQSNTLDSKVTGIGGIFFFSDDPETTKNWYTKNLGLEVNESGSSFEFRNAYRPEEINYLQLSPFKTRSDYFTPSKKAFMINYQNDRKKS